MNQTTEENICIGKTRKQKRRRSSECPAGVCWIMNELMNGLLNGLVNEN